MITKRRWIGAIVGLTAALLAFGVAYGRVSPRVPPWNHPKFLWGVSNSAFQVEGQPGDSDWRRWTRTPGKIKDGTNADRVTDFWENYRDDFRLARELGLNAFRISIAWERVEPRPGVWDEAAIERYRDMIRAMRAEGLEPIVTLHHFVTPGWLVDRGGLMADDFIPQFVAYSRRMVSELSRGEEGAKIWITINEPMVMVMAGYADGVFPPGINDLPKTPFVAARLAEAHIEAVRAIRKLGDPSIRVSIAQNWVRFAPKSPGNPIDETLVRVANEFYNHAFIRSVVTGEIDFGVGPWHPVRKRVPLPDGRSSIDFLGVNYYFRSLMSVTMKAPFIRQDPSAGLADDGVTDMGWSIYPEGLRELLVEAYERYQLPILITENGIADRADTKRARFLDAHLAAMQAARRQGVPVLGYTQWSLTDNFEWAEGLNMRFGLVAVDYATGLKTPRASYHHFGQRVREIGFELGRPRQR